MSLALLEALFDIPGDWFQKMARRNGIPGAGD